MKNKPNIIPQFDKHCRFLKFITISEDSQCWNWVGGISKGGYGVFHIGGKQYLSHRVSFSIFRGDLDLSRVADHKCMNRRCCNPDHLRQVTDKQNSLENSVSLFAVNIRKTHCIRGHEFNNTNTYTQGGTRRRCRACDRLKYAKAVK